MTVFAIDFSGGILDGQIDKMIQDVKNKANGSDTVVAFDHRLIKTVLAKDIDQLKTVRGGGGTNPRPIFDFASKNNHADVVIYTDGHFYHDKSSHSLNVRVVLIGQDANKNCGYPVIGIL